MNEQTETLEEIRSRPQTETFEAGAKVHESIFRSWSIIRRVQIMLDRGDSPETIKDFIRDATECKRVEALRG